MESPTNFWAAPPLTFWCSETAIQPLPNWKGRAHEQKLSHRWQGHTLLCTGRETFGKKAQKILVGRTRGSMYSNLERNLQAPEHHFCQQDSSSCDLHLKPIRVKRVKLMLWAERSAFEPSRIPVKWERRKQDEHPSVNADFAFLNKTPP